MKLALFDFAVFLLFRTFVGKGRHIALQKEGTKIWEGINFVAVPDIVIGQLKAEMDVRIFIGFYQSTHRFCLAASCFYFERDQCIFAADKEILFESGILPFIVKQAVTGFHKSFTDYVFI